METNDRPAFTCPRCGCSHPLGCGCLPIPLEDRPELTIGPFFVRTSARGVAADDVVHAGASLEIATSDAGKTVPIYRKYSTLNHDECTLSSLLVHADDLPCEVLYTPFFGAKTSKGDFIPLDSVLVGLFKEYHPQRSIFSVLDDLLDAAPVNHGEFNRDSRVSGRLVQNAEAAGFTLMSASAYSQRVFACIGWIPTKERSRSGKRVSLFVCILEFKPRPDGTIGLGSWREPRETGVANTLFYELRRRFPGDPVNLFTDAGKSQLLSVFKWTRLSRMTAKQAREARIQFIREHPELAGQPRAMAEGLSKAGLYAESTSIRQITKSIQSLMRDATRPC